MLLMRAHVGELVLVLGLLVSARCEVRARDPEVEVEEEEEGGEGEEGEEEVMMMALGGGGRGERGGLGSSAHPLLPRGARPVGHQQPLGLPEEVAPSAGEGGSYPARTGNWCAFVQKRVVTTAVACGTEKYTIKSQSPCPNGTPDCQLVMYKLSTRPVYRQKQKIFTALLWRCCPGHGGDNCEDTVTDGQLSHSEDSSLIGHSEPGSTEVHAPAVQARLQTDVDQEQNDFQVPVTTTLHDDVVSHHGVQNDTALSEEAELTAGPTYDHRGHAHHHPHASTHDHAHNANPHLHHGNHQQPNYNRPDVDVPYPDLPSSLPLTPIITLIMVQLQPVFEGFNRTLEELTRQVGDLSRDVAHMRGAHHQGANQGSDVRRETPPGGVDVDSGGGGGRAVEQWVNTKLDEIHSEINEVGRRMHSQHAMLHHNLTVFKMEVDLKLKRNHKLLQANLQAMNSTLADMRLDQEQLAEELQGGGPPPPPPPPVTHPQQAQDHHQPPMNLSAVWTAFERLNDKVVNNTVKVDGLVEDLDSVAGDVTQVRSLLVGLEQRIGQAERTNQIHFMETGLEVEAAKVTVLNRVNELAGNTSEQNRRLAMLDEDVDDLYSLWSRNTSSSDCDCRALRTDMALLQDSLANVSQLANDNRLSLEGTGGDLGAAAHWEDMGAWQPLVNDLQQGLRQVKDSLAFEQERTRTLSRDVSQLGGEVAGRDADVAALQEGEQRLAEDMRRLSSSFQSLLQDAMRHTDVLERLLGEEVLEFLARPAQDQEDRLLELHDRLLGDGGGAVREESPAADEPSSWYTPDARRGGGARERQVLHREGEEVYGRTEGGFVSPGDGGDLWNLERSVEELAVKLRRLEEERPSCSASCHNGSKDAGDAAAALGGPEEAAKLQAEVRWLRRGLEDHLRVFKNVFSNADVLAASDAMTLDLDELWALLWKKRSKEGKRQKRKGGSPQKRDVAAAAAFRGVPPHSGPWVVQGFTAGPP